MELVFAFFSVIIGIIYLLYRYGKNGIGSGFAPFAAIASVIGVPIIIAVIFGSSDNYIMHAVGGFLAAGYFTAFAIFAMKKGKQDEQDAKRKQEVYEIVKKMDPTTDELEMYKKILFDRDGIHCYSIWDQRVINCWYQDTFQRVYHEEFGDSKKTDDEVETQRITDILKEVEHMEPTEDELKKIQQDIYASEHHYYALNDPYLRSVWIKQFTAQETDQNKEEEE